MRALENGIQRDSYIAVYIRFLDMRTVTFDNEVFIRETVLFLDFYQMLKNYTFASLFYKDIDKDI